MYRPLYKRVWLCTVAAAWAGPLPAQEYEPGHLLDEIVVTADPLRRVDDHLARPVDVLGERDLRRRESRSIGELVAGEPGVSSSDYGPAVGRPVIRGLSGGRVRILEDGIGTMDLSTISADHAVSSDPLFARQVEIFRGPSTLLYGSGASGGLVNVVTGRIPEYVPAAIETELQMQYETVSRGVAAAGRVRGGTGAMALQAAGLLRDTNDYSIPGFSEATPDEHDLKGALANSAASSGNIGASASWIAAQGRLGVAVTRSANEYGIPGHGHEENGGEEDGLRIDQEQVRYDVEGVLPAPVSWLRELRTRWGFNDYGHQELEAGAAGGTRYANREMEGRVELLHERLAGWDGVAGVQYRHRDFEAAGDEVFLPPSQLESFALFLLEKRDFARWHVEAGARFEHQHSSSRGLDRDHGVFSLSGGVRREYAGGYQLGAAVTHAQRAPDMEELFAGGPHAASGTFEVGDPSLGDETATNIDLYWRRTAGRVTFSANLFYNHIARFIYLQSADLDEDGVPDRVAEDFAGDAGTIGTDGAELLLVRQVQTDARFYGGELEADFNLFNDRRGDLHLRLWSDYVRGELEGGGDLPRITPWRTGAGLDFERGPFEAGLEYMRVHRQDRTGPLEDATPGYHMLDAWLGYSLAGSAWEATFFARLSNLLNEEARRHTSFLKDRAPLPGISGTAGVRLAF